MFTQAICLTHYSDEFIARLELLGYINSQIGYRKSDFSGSSEKTRDDMCICTAVRVGESSYTILSKETALSHNPYVSWVNKEVGRYITDNEMLAFALASLRNDNADKYRFFTLDCNLAGLDNPAKVNPKGELVFCTRDNWNVDFDENGNPWGFSNRNVPAHKSTKEEIINYFSKDNN